MCLRIKYGKPTIQLAGSWKDLRLWGALHRAQVPTCWDDNFNSESHANMTLVALLLWSVIVATENMHASCIKLWPNSHSPLKQPRAKLQIQKLCGRSWAFFTPSIFGQAKKVLGKNSCRSLLAGKVSDCPLVTDLFYQQLVDCSFVSAAAVCFSLSLWLHRLFKSECVCARILICVHMKIYSLSGVCICLRIRMNIWKTSARIGGLAERSPMISGHWSS